MKRKPLIITTVLLSLFCIVQCKKDDTGPTNIILHNKPLKTIQDYIQGKWLLQYSKGGIANFRYKPKYNSYLKLESNNITIGNDSLGVVVDTAIIWKKDKCIFGDSTYLLTYSYSKGYSFPIIYIVDQIFNDTLILTDNAYDAVSYGYVKSK